MAEAHVLLMGDAGLLIEEAVTAELVIIGVLDRHHGQSFVRKMTNCPIAGRGLRIAEQGSGERGPLLIHRSLDIKASFGESCEQIRFRVEPVALLRHAVDDVGYPARALPASYSAPRRR